MLMIACASPPQAGHEIGASRSDTFLSSEKTSPHASHSYSYRGTMHHSEQPTCKFETGLKSEHPAIFFKTREFLPRVCGSLPLAGFSEKGIKDHSN